MSSLYNKLKGLQPLPQVKRKELPQELLIKTTTVELAEIQGSHLPGQTVSMLRNQPTGEDLPLSSILFIDTETTGLSRGVGTVAFLIGYGQIVGSSLRITQVLMRDYPQEPDLLLDFVQRMDACGLLVSYNGASFDLPLLTGRLTLNRMPNSLQDKPHLDLLHAARRVFKLRLGRCPLGRMEEMVFGFARADDLPGSEVPKRYFDYLKQQDESLLNDVLAHNQQDIVTLARLFLHLAGLYQEPLRSSHQQDVFSLGRAFERQGHAQQALRCYRACSRQDVQELARLRMGELYRRQKMDQQAVQVFEGLRNQGRLSARLFISLAKIYEHRYRDPVRALEIAKQGMLYCTERLGSGAENDPAFLDLQKRSLRLMRKVENLR